MRVLIVEDETLLAQSLERGLRQRGFAVDIAFDGQQGLDKALINEYDLVLLDRDLPSLHGDDVCRQMINSGRSARILMLTAADSVEDLVNGLNIGADDYLPKPFEFAVLLARMQALLRRVGTAAPSILRHGDLEFDPGRFVASRGGVQLQLTQREVAVLEVLLRAEGRVVSSEELLERAWDEHVDPFTASVRVIMSRLRSKLGEPPVIETVIGKGYRLCELS
jgi:DNA-binding response OmpR family regulator